MHIIESYASVARARINKPVLSPKFYPIPFEDYITFHATSKFDSRQYDWWGEVISLLKPYLDGHNIKIVQIGGKEDIGATGIDLNLCGQVSYRQTYDVIQKAKLHLGVDSLPIHIASVFGTKIVALYSNMYVEHSKPYWSDPKDVILLQAPLGNKKPSYASEDNPKIINLIRPEEIAKSVLELLNIKENIDRKSFYFGNLYRSLSLESVPDGIVDPKCMEGTPLYIRYDYVSESETTKSFLYNQISLRPSIIITDKLLDENILRQLKSNILQIVIQVTNGNQVSIAKQAEKLGISYVLISELSIEEIQKLKLTYLDNIPITKRGPVKKEDVPNLEGNLKETTKFKSSKILISQNKAYASKAHWKLGKDSNPLSENLLIEFIDNEEFWKESEFCYFYN